MESRVRVTVGLLAPHPARARPAWPEGKRLEYREREIRNRQQKPQAPSAWLNPRQRKLRRLCCHLCSSQAARMRRLQSLRPAMTSLPDRIWTPRRMLPW